MALQRFWYNATTFCDKPETISSPTKMFIKKRDPILIMNSYINIYIIYIYISYITVMTPNPSLYFFLSSQTNHPHHQHLHAPLPQGSWVEQLDRSCRGMAKKLRPWPAGSLFGSHMAEEKHQKASDILHNTSIYIYIIYIIYYIYICIILYIYMHLHMCILIYD